jgi:NAD(P)-dependent dehydrogenase (short-subunit alcohol dehydrogenase family)
LWPSTAGPAHEAGAVVIHRPLELMMQLKGKVALVTGASRGIGKQIALELAREGAHIVLAARTAQGTRSPYPGTIEQTAQEIRSLGVKAVPVKCDLAVRTEVEQLCRTALNEFGAVDILVNNAFYTGPGHYDPFLTMTPEQWEIEIAVDVTAPAIASWMLLPEMIERHAGIIICITSGAAHTDPPGMPGRGATGPAYPAAKAALNRFVQAIAREFKDNGVAVIAVDPGFTLTERAEIAVSQWGFDLAQAHPMAVPAKTVHYLCTRANPIEYTGKVLVAADFAREHRLL